MKKITAIVCLLLILSLVGCGAKTEQMTDGTYTGKAKGFKADVEVEVIVAEGKIKEVKVLSHQETEDIAADALTNIPAAIVEKQKTDVDSVSGATKTSDAIKAAAAQALEKAKK